MTTNRMSNEPSVCNEMIADMKRYIFQGKSISFLADYVFITWKHRPDQTESFGKFFSQALTLLLEYGEAGNIAFFVNILNEKFDTDSIENGVLTEDLYYLALKKISELNGFDNTFAKEFFSESLLLFCINQTPLKNIAIFVYEFEKKFEEINSIKDQPIPVFCNIAMYTIIHNKLSPQFLGQFIKELAKEGEKRGYKYPSNSVLNQNNAKKITSHHFFGGKQSPRKRHEKELVWREKRPGITSVS